MCNIKLYGHIITAQCSILFIQNSTSHFHGTEYKFSSFLIALRDIKYIIKIFIIKVQRVKITAWQPRETKTASQASGF